MSKRQETLVDFIAMLKVIVKEAGVTLGKKKRFYFITKDTVKLSYYLLLNSRMYSTASYIR